MPNWCDNHITVSGDDESLDALWEIIKPDGEDAHADLTKAFPCPQPLRDTMAGFMGEDNPEYATWMEKRESNISTYGSADWYDWCNANWGTKWSPNFDYSDPSEGDLVLNGDSAWSPPIELLKNVSGLFPTLTFRIRYHELGCDFVGAAIIQNTRVVESNGSVSEHVTADEDSDDYWQVMSDMVDDLESAHEAAAEGLWAVMA